MIKLRTKYKITLLLAAAIFTMMSQSCKQGCTDPKAFNYVQGAKQDDASCLYCDSTVYTSVTSYTNTYYDYNSSSIHYGEGVLYVNVNENEMYYTGNGCKVLGLSNNSNCIRYSFSAQLYNQTSSTLVLTGDMVTAVNFQSVTYRFSGQSIPPHQSVTVNVGSLCDNGFSFHSNLLNPVFQYR